MIYGLDAGLMSSCAWGQGWSVLTEVYGSHWQLPRVKIDRLNGAHVGECGGSNQVWEEIPLIFRVTTRGQRQAWLFA